MNPRNGNTLVDLSNPMFMHMFNQLGNDIAPGTVISNLTVSYNGITVMSAEKEIKVIGSAKDIAFLNY